MDHFSYSQKQIQQNEQKINSFPAQAQQIQNQNSNGFDYDYYSKNNQKREIIDNASLLSIQNSYSNTQNNAEFGKEYKSTFRFNSNYINCQQPYLKGEANNQNLPPNLLQQNQNFNSQQQYQDQSYVDRNSNNPNILIDKSPQSKQQITFQLQSPYLYQKNQYTHSQQIQNDFSNYNNNPLNKRRDASPLSKKQNLISPEPPFQFKKREENNKQQSSYDNSNNTSYNVRSKNMDESPLQNKQIGIQAKIKSNNQSIDLQRESISTFKNSFMEQICVPFNQQNQNQNSLGLINQTLCISQDFPINQTLITNNDFVQKPKKVQQNIEVKLPKRVDESDLRQISQQLQTFQQTKSQFLNKNEVDFHLKKFQDVLDLFQKNEQQFIQNINLLRMDVQTKQTQINELNNNIEKHKNSYNQLKIDSRKLQNELELQLKSKQQQIEENEIRYQELNSSQSQQISDLNEKLHELNKNYNNLRQYESLFQQSQQKIKQLQQSLTDKENQIYLQNQNSDELESSLKNLKEQISSDKKGLEKLMNEQKIQSELREKEFEQSKKKLLDEISEFKAQVNTLTNQNKHLEQFQIQLQEKVDQNKKLQEIGQENNKQIQLLQQNLVEEKQKLASIQKQNETLNQNIVRLERNAVKTNELQKNLEVNADSQNKQINDLANKNNELSIQLRKEQETVTSQQLEIQKQKQDIQQQKTLNDQNITKMQEQANTLQQKMDETNKELANLKGLQKNSEYNYQLLQQALKDKNQEIENMKKENLKLQKDLEENKQKQQEAVKKIIENISYISVKEQNDDKKVKEVLTQLNPQVQIQQNQIEFAKAFSTIEQNKPTEQQKANLKSKSEQIVQKYLSDQQNSQYLAVNSKVQDKNTKPNSIECLLALQSMYQADGVTTYITDESIQNLEKEESYQKQQSFIQIGMHNKASYFSLKFNEQTSLYNELMQTQTSNNLNQFLEKFKQNIGNQIGSLNPQQDVVIIKVGFVQVPQINFQVNSNKYTNKEIKKIINFKDIGVSLSEQSLLESAKLSVNMFNPQYNMYWDEQNYKGKSEFRGQLKFYNQPNPVNHVYTFPVGYKGYALDISKYGSDQSWLSQKTDDKTWIVLFHGTNENAINGIANYNLAPGQRNAYQGQKCRITGTQIKSGSYSNVYLTDRIQVAESFAIQTQMHHGKRVNPRGVKSPESMISYYTVEDNLNIRPYRILLKEC